MQEGYLLNQSSTFRMKRLKNVVFIMTCPEQTVIIMITFENGTLNLNLLQFTPKCIAKKCLLHNFPSVENNQQSILNHCINPIAQNLDRTQDRRRPRPPDNHSQFSRLLRWFANSPTGFSPATTPSWRPTKPSIFREIRRNRAIPDR